MAVANGPPFLIDHPSPASSFVVRALSGLAWPHARLPKWAVTGAYARSRSPLPFPLADFANPEGSRPGCTTPRRAEPLPPRCARLVEAKEGAIAHLHPMLGAVGAAQCRVTDP